MLSSLHPLGRGPPLGVPSRDSNSGLPYSKPMRYILSHTAHFLSHTAPLWQNFASSLSNTFVFCLLFLKKNESSLFFLISNAKSLSNLFASLRYWYSFIRNQFASLANMIFCNNYVRFASLDLHFNINYLRFASIF